MKRQKRMAFAFVTACALLAARHGPAIAADAPVTPIPDQKLQFDGCYNSQPSQANNASANAGGSQATPTGGNNTVSALAKQVSQVTAASLLAKDGQSPANQAAAKGAIDPCLVAGAVVLPFKMQLSRNRDVAASFTVGALVGWKIGNTNFESCKNTDPGKIGQFCGLGNMTIVGFAGPTALQTTSGSTSSGNGSTLTGISYGAGIMFPLGDPFNFTANGAAQSHIGFFVGFDHVSNSSHYQYNDKPWLSLVLGVSF
jgi:hypothetical protein